MRYKEGRGVGADHDEAVRWYRLSAAQGNRGARQGLADYLFRSGRPEDRAEGFRMMLDLAEEGESVYQRKVAEAYWDGDVVGRDPEQAVRWYRLCAQAGDRALGRKAAQIMLGRLYWLGEGVGRDPAQARRWFAAAAEGRGRPETSLGPALPMLLTATVVSRPRPSLV